MFCCRPPPVFQDPTPQIVDLADVLNDKAWKSFRNSLGPLQRMMLKKKNYDIEVPKKYFDFEDIDQIITPSKKFHFKHSRFSGSKGTPIDRALSIVKDGHGTDKFVLLKGNIHPTRELTNSESVSLYTEFQNETAEQQLYKFHFEKTCRSEIDVTFQKGVTAGRKAIFSIRIPYEHMNPEADIQYKVTQSDGQQFEELVLVEATSDITVGPNSCYIAIVQLEERTIDATFKIISRMSLPQGRAPVYIKRKSDGQKVFVYYVNNLIETFKDSVPGAQVVKNEDGSVIVGKLDFVIEGLVKGSLPCNHKIILTSKELEDFKKEVKFKIVKKIPKKSLVNDDTPEHNF